MNELMRRLLFLPPQASTFAVPIDWFHFVVIGITMLGATGVAITTLLFMWRYRRLRDGDATPQTHARLRQEIFIAGSLLTMFLAWWVVGFRQYVAMEMPPEGATEVYVTAKQWMWKFAMPGGRRSISVLTVPVGRPVKLVMTSRDVIHSFFVPAFRIKQDVIPGRYTTVWFEATEPGTYDIFCTEYCGVSHSRMRGVVVALSQPDYDAWLARTQEQVQLAGEDFENAGGAGEPSGGDLVELGRKVASRKQCFACHAIDGQRHIGPSWRGLYRAPIPLADGRTMIADEAYLTRSMMDPASEVHAGYKPVMPTYQGILEAPEAAAIVEFIKSLRELDEEKPEVQLPTIDDAGVQPSDAPVAASDTELPPIDAGNASEVSAADAISFAPDGVPGE
jgi:cytochrome c oxidase subunit 2